MKRIVKPLCLSLVVCLALVATASAELVRTTGLTINARGPYWVAPGRSIRLDPMARFDGVDPDPIADDLGRIARALVGFHDAYGAFPPAYVVDASGTPLYSWRVLILPFLGEQDLFNRFDLSKAWNDPANQPLLASMPDAYRRPGEPMRSTNTGYAAAYGAGAVFAGGQDPAEGYPDASQPHKVFTSGVRIGDIVDGASNTLLVGEVGPAVHIPWSSPGDVGAGNFAALGDPAAFASKVPGYASFLFADGSVRFLEDAVDATDIAHMTTYAGGDIIGADLDASSLETHYAWDLYDKGIPPGGGFSFETPGSHPIFTADDLPLGSMKTIALEVVSLDGLQTLVSTAKVHVVTPPVADLYHLMSGIGALPLSFTDNRTLMMPLRHAIFHLARPTASRKAAAIADVQQFMAKVQAIGNAGLLDAASAGGLLAAAQAILDEIPAL
ncbi:MAG TPA: DUF1559 domain-containing protein [Patescibacteria group bacterium]|nr:DUF1559 domain-containing protein [Patescibacteria group bacterium]